MHICTHIHTHINMIEKLFHALIFTFSKQDYNEFFKIFATVHSFMNDINFIDSCQAHLPVQYASDIDSFVRIDTGVVIDSKPQPSRTCKTSLHWLSVIIRLFCFSVLVHSDKTVNTFTY